MLRFDVSPIVGAEIGASLVVDVETGPHSLVDLQVKSLRGAVQVMRVQDGLLVQGTVQAELESECVRCLEPSDAPVTLELEDTYALPGTASEPGNSLAIGDDGMLDLTPLLRDQGWLGVPMKSLCSESCKGLCSTCGTNLNKKTCKCAEDRIDPRLAALKNLLH